jgi:DNA-binding response OmpR family regulator
MNVSTEMTQRTLRVVRNDSAALLRWRDLSMDPRSRRVRRAGKELFLTRREAGLLFVLMREPRRIFTREELLITVWGNDFRGSSTIVDTYVSYLRTRLDHPGSPSYVRTVRGCGYGMAM